MKDAKQGRLGLDLGKAWIKSAHLTAGQCPVMKYHRNLMEAILWGRMDYLSEVTSIEVITPDRAPEAYRTFDQGAPKKFVIDPHGSLKSVA